MGAPAKRTESMLGKRRGGRETKTCSDPPKRVQMGSTPPPANGDLFWEDLTGNVDLECDEKWTKCPGCPPPWTLSASEIPSDAKKIYCVLRGHEPGFYFNWPDAERQVSGYRDNVFKAFPQGSKKSSLQNVKVENVIRDAVQYMNHPQEPCPYGCAGGKCRLPVSAPSSEEKCPPPIEERPASPELTLEYTYRCRNCHKLPKVPGGQICAPCFASTGLKVKAKAVSDRFGLDKQQACALNLIAHGKNVFFTGAAGTGKSRVLHAATTFFHERCIRAHVIAPTGIAALAVGGRTIHTYAGWDARLATATLGELCDVAHKKSIRKRFVKTDVLIIDEISMVESDMLTRLSAMMESVRCTPDNPKPFGGVQVVITGDFYQLAPVRPFQTCLYCKTTSTRHEDSAAVTCTIHGVRHDAEKWAFQSPVWSALKLTNIELRSVHRQPDPQYTAILHRIRTGVPLTEGQERILCSAKEDFDFGSAVKLMPTREVVDSINAHHMDKLQTEVHTYSAIDHFNWEKAHSEYAEHSPKVPSHHRYASSLELKEGMHVLLLANLDLAAGLANGTSGVIVGFEPMFERSMPRAKKNSKDDSMHGEALIVHEHRHYAEQRVRDFAIQARSKQWPVVRFRNGRERTIYADCSVTELGEDRPYSLLSRTQIPLVAGWAITIHKSQGMTLDSVVATLDKCFVPGQAYVALSRAKSLQNMVVQSLPEPERLAADSTVQQFMQAIFVRHTLPA